MKITFIQSCEPCLASGWSAYPVGAKADLVRGAELVSLGIAHEGWKPIQPEPEPVPEKIQIAPKEITHAPEPVQAEPVIEPEPKPKPAPKRRTRRTSKGSK